MKPGPELVLVPDGPRTSSALLGSIERVVFQNPDSGWCVLKVKVKGRRRLVTVVGHGVHSAVGEEIEAEGEWTEHSEYGERFMASRLRTTLPRAAAAAEKYLGSGLIRGIGPQLAHRMVARFGASIFDVIEREPSLLRAIDGIGEQRAESVREAWAEQKSLRAIMAFLSSHGLSVSKAPRIYRALGADALAVIERNPFCLTREVPGIGFKSADLIARHFGLPLHSEERFAAALQDRLQAAVAKGHCAYPSTALLREAARELQKISSEAAQDFAFTNQMQALKDALDSEIEAGRLSEEEIDGTVCVFPAHLALAERRLAANLSILNTEKSAVLKPLSSSSARAVALAVPMIHPLGEKQKSALQILLRAKVGVLTGGPGTGKTTLIQALHREWRARGGVVACCAPSGRAAQRLFEATGVEAQTIHRLLGWDHAAQGFRYTSERRLSLDLLIVDEASMVGLELMDALVQALPETASLLLVGDVDQLPSVQAGRVLASIVDAKVFAHVHLEEVFRQRGGQESLIIQAAHDVLHGHVPALITRSPEQDFHFIETRNNSVCVDRVVQLVRERIPARFGFDPQTSIQVLCPMNKGETGARALNKKLQEALNPSPSDSIERFGDSFAVGDKVIATVNDYDKEIFNGDLGRIVLIERERSSLRIDFSGRRIDFDFTELDSLALAFAVTIHKAQGSEYEAVVIPLMEESAPLLGRNLLYTAITRGRRLVVIVGSREAIWRSVRAEPHLDKRWSGLAKRLAGACLSQG